MLEGESVDSDEHRREPDEDIDDPGDQRILPAEQIRHQIKLEEAYEPPVDAADNQQSECDPIERVEVSPHSDHFLHFFRDLQWSDATLIRAEVTVSREQAGDSTPGEQGRRIRTAKAVL